MNSDVMARRWFYISVSVIIALVLLIAWSQFNRVDRRLDRVISSQTEVRAYSTYYPSGEADPLEIWLHEPDSFISLYSVGSDNLASPNYAMIGQVGKFEVRCEYEQPERTCGPTDISEYI